RPGRAGLMMLALVAGGEPRGPGRIVQGGYRDAIVAGRVLTREGEAPSVGRDRGMDGALRDEHRRSPQLRHLPDRRLAGAIGHEGDGRSVREPGRALAGRAPPVRRRRLPPLMSLIQM